MKLFPLQNIIIRERLSKIVNLQSIATAAEHTAIVERNFIEKRQRRMGPINCFQLVEKSNYVFAADLDCSTLYILKCGRTFKDKQMDPISRTL